MQLQGWEVDEIIKEIIPFYYQYQMLDSILEKTEKEMEEKASLQKKLRMYHRLLRDAFPCLTENMYKEKVALYLRKLERCCS